MQKGRGNSFSTYDKNQAFSEMEKAKKAAEDSSIN